MESRRLSCSFIAFAAASISAKVLGCAGAVCEMTAWVPGSTFRTALQQGQVTSKGGAFFAIYAKSYRKPAYRGESFIGKICNRFRSSQPSRLMETMTTSTAALPQSLVGYDQVRIAGQRVPGC